MAVGNDGCNSSNYGETMEYGSQELQHGSVRVQCVGRGLGFYL